MRYKHLQSFYKKVIVEPVTIAIFDAQSIMNRILLLTVFMLSSGLISAQTDTVQIDVVDSLIGTTAEDTLQILTNVNVFKDPRLDVLKKRPTLVARTKARKRIIEKRKEKLGVTNVKNYNAINRGRKKVTGSIVSRKGYRVVIYNGNSRTQALAAKRKFMRSYPGVRSYLSYRSPSYKIRVGNFASKTSAYRFLRKIQGAGFSKSFVAPDIVTIKDINVR